MAVGFGWLLSELTADLLHPSLPSPRTMPWGDEDGASTQRHEARLVGALERVLTTARVQSPDEAFATLQVLLSAVRRLPPSPQVTRLLRRVHRAQRRCQHDLSKQRLRQWRNNVGGGSPVRLQPHDVLRLATQQRKRRTREASTYRRMLDHIANTLDTTAPSNLLGGTEQRRLVDPPQLKPVLTFERLVTWAWLLKHVVSVLQQQNLQTDHLREISPQQRHRVIERFLDRCRARGIRLTTLILLDEVPEAQRTKAQQEQVDQVNALLLSMGLAALSDALGNHRVRAAQVAPTPSTEFRPHADHAAGQQPAPSSCDVSVLQPTVS